MYIVYTYTNVHAFVHAAYILHTKIIVHILLSYLLIVG